MRTPIVRGRSLNESDVPGATPVVLVSETLARQWWPEGNPIGSRVRIGYFRGKKVMGGGDPPREVVGVVADMKHVDLRGKARPTVYVTMAQAEWYDQSFWWVVRSNSPAGLVDTIRRTVAELAPGARVANVRTMNDIVARNTRDSRFDAWLLGSLAGLALVLTAMGLYGLLSFSVARRTNEIGTRMALGAASGDVLRLILGDAAGLVLLGLAIGLGGAFGVTRLLSGLLFGVKATDPASFAVVAALLLIVGMAASYIPARRAVKVDPMVALRWE
jgi:putative ABC transport system permease protein